MKNHKGQVATFLTLGLVVVGTLITLGTSLFVGNRKNNLATNSMAAEYNCTAAQGTEISVPSNSSISCKLTCTDTYKGTYTLNTWTEAGSYHCCCNKNTQPAPNPNVVGSSYAYPNGTRCCLTKPNHSSCKELDLVLIYAENLQKANIPASSCDGDAAYGGTLDICPLDKQAGCYNENGEKVADQYQVPDGTDPKTPAPQEGECDNNMECGAVVALPNTNINNHWSSMGDNNYASPDCSGPVVNTDVLKAYCTKSVTNGSCISSNDQFTPCPDNSYKSIFHTSTCTDANANCWGSTSESCLLTKQAAIDEINTNICVGAAPPGDAGQPAGQTLSNLDCSASDNFGCDSGEFCTDDSTYKVPCGLCMVNESSGNRNRCVGPNKDDYQCSGYNYAAMKVDSDCADSETIDGKISYKPSEDGIVTVNFTSPAKPAQNGYLINLPTAGVVYVNNL